MVGAGSTTLAQHCPYVNILSLAVGSITSWNQYYGPTLGQCTTVACFDMAELRWVHYVGPTLAHSNTCTLTHCWFKGVDPTVFCSSAFKWTNMLALRSAIVLAQGWVNIYPWLVGPLLASTR